MLNIFRKPRSRQWIHQIPISAESTSAPWTQPKITSFEALFPEWLGIDSEHSKSHTLRPLLDSIRAKSPERRLNNAQLDNPTVDTHAAGRNFEIYLNNLCKRWQQHVDSAAHKKIIEKILCDSCHHARKCGKISRSCIPTPTVMLTVGNFRHVFYIYRGSLVCARSIPGWGFKKTHRVSTFEEEQMTSTQRFFPLPAHDFVPCTEQNGKRGYCLF